jgi:hypothetical protein
MLTQFAASPAETELLLDVELEPDEGTLRKSTPRGEPDPGTLLTARGRRNRVQIGVPQVLDVLAAWPADERLAQEIEAARDVFDFLSVRLACSFIADRGCRFTFVRYGMRLTADDHAPPPHAVDLFPQSVTDRKQFSRSYTLDAKLNFGFGELGAGGGREAEVIEYEPSVTASGLLTDAPSWAFRATSGRHLDGTRETFMVVKAPIGATVRARFAVEAEVQTAFGPIRLRRYRQPELLTTSYELVPS